MSGKIHYEGQEYLGNTSLKNTGHSTLYIGLYKNASPLTKNENMLSIVEATGGGYSRKTLSNAEWIIDPTKTTNQGTLLVQLRQTWLFNAAIGNVTGYFITTSPTGNTGKLIATEHFPSPANVNQSDFEIRVTPRIEYK